MATIRRCDWLSHRDGVPLVSLALMVCSAVACSKPDSAGKKFDSDSGAIDTAVDRGDSMDDSPVDTWPPPAWGEPLDASADAKLVGPEPFGGTNKTMSVAGGGDVDGDGYADLLVGLPGGYYSSPGNTYLVRGPVAGTLDLAIADANLAGSSSEQSGHSVAFAGDVNADGYDDVLVGAPDYNSDNSDGCVEGRAYLELGPIVGGRDLADADAVLFGKIVSKDQGMSWWSAGWSVSGAGDVDADGFDDLLVVEKLLGTFLLRGPVSGEVELATEADVLIENVPGGDVYSASSAGDTNGDGLDDILIGQPYFVEATVVLFEGPVDGTSRDDADVVFANPDGEYSGYWPRSVGDADGDGYDDVIIDAVVEPALPDEPGAAVVLHGPFEPEVDLSSATLTMINEDSMAGGGISVDGVGDVNADGFDDLLIGGTDLQDDHFTSRGMAYVLLSPLSGTVSLADAHARLNGDLDDAAGRFVSTAGDVDNDGLADILIGGPGDDDGGEDAGAAWLVLGASIP